MTPVVLSGAPVTLSGAKDLCGTTGLRPVAEILRLRPQDDFAHLVDDVQACRRCPAMEGRRRVLSDANGPLDARVLFVAEAPGRLGGDRTGIPLTSDQTGRNFTRLLAEAGLRREDVFVTNAVLCNPRAPDGRNRPPSNAERANCLDHLTRLLALVHAPIVVSLGAVALGQLHAVSPHHLTLRDVGQPSVWCDRTLVPLYHPGPRAQIHRPFSAQQADFRALRDTIAGLGG